MSEDYQDKHNRTRTRLNAMRHFFFGVLLNILAVVVFRNQRIGNFDFGQGGSYVFGSLLVLYGLFRLWRGYADLRGIGRDNT